MPVRILLALALTAGFLMQGCFAWRSSAGGSQATFTPPRPVQAGDIALPPQYTIEAVADTLTFPTGVTFDDQGRVYVVEAGYAYGEVWATPRLLRIEGKGGKTIIAEGRNNGPWTGVIFHRGHFYVAEGGTLRGGSILKISMDGKIQVIVEGLPSTGDHHTNGPLAGPDGLYFSVGTMTNSAVVGEDNARFGWLARYPNAHDIPCRDISLVGENFPSPNPQTPEPNDTATTGAFSPFGHSTEPKQVIAGQVPCNGAILKISWDGSNGMELVAWGLRNPFGLAFAPDGRLFATDNSYDDRGSRPVHGTGDLLWAITPGTWYGWPDYHGSRLLSEGDHFIPPGKPRPKPLLAHYPNTPPEPAAMLGVHASADGFDFSRTGAFGHVGQAFVALFGDMSPNVGKVLAPVGFKVVRVDTSTGVIEDFAVNKGRLNGPASHIGGGGFERPVAARFDPSGRALYVVDFGVLTIGQGGKVRAPWASSGPAAEPRHGTGVLWKITTRDAAP